MTDKGEGPGLADVEVTSGVARDPDGFRGFCHVTASASDGSTWEGQLDPGEVRLMAMGFLEAAEASDHDAAVANLLTSELGAPLEVVAGFLQALREQRAKGTNDR